MNGADLLCDSLLVNGVDVCFANPGTSEMHFVAALDRRPEMRCVLGLFEGVVTGAADGYARMAEKPAATLLHLGPGLANGLANVHNARRARTPLINVVGDHASYHLAHDAPLTSDIESLARPMSNWVGRIGSPDAVAPAVADAYTAAMTTPGVATLILPGDAAWNDATPIAPEPVRLPATPRVEAAAVEFAAAALRSRRRATLFLGGRALRARALDHAARIAAKTGARLLAETSNARMERGAGRVSVPKLPYAVDAAVETLRDVEVLLMIGSRPPVGFFAYPGKPGLMAPPDCEIVPVAEVGQDLEDALAQLADAVGAGPFALPPGAAAPDRDAPTDGVLTDDAIARVLAGRIPDGAILCDEAVTSGRRFFGLTEGAAPHDVIALTGGAIGLGIPMAAGAAIACPDRKVIGLQADGSGMYTVQGLWTQARENLDVLTIVFANRAYAILQGEMRNVGVNQYGRNARRMLDLDEPVLDWVGMARGMGVDGGRATTVAEFTKLLDGALGQRGPYVLEAVI